VFYDIEDLFIFNFIDNHNICCSMKITIIPRIPLFRKYINSGLLIVLFPVFIQFSCVRKPDNSFRFVYMADIHVQPELKADEGFRTALNKVSMLDPDFIITGGDLIMDALEEDFERSVELYDLHKQICGEYDIPIYNTMGNHEVFGLYVESGVSPDHPEYGKKMYKRRLGNNKTYYSFDHKGWHFIIIDAVGFTPDREYFGTVDSIQMEWIKEDLKKTDKKTPIIISTHIPFISVSEQVFNGGTTALRPYLAVENSNDVLSLFDGYNLTLVLQGHLHVVEYIVFRDIHYITCGAVSGAWWGGPYKNFPEGFVVIDIDKGRFTWRYETFGWEAVKTIEK
jgi:Icc protein